MLWQGGVLFLSMSIEYDTADAPPWTLTHQIWKLSLPGMCAYILQSCDMHRFLHRCGRKQLLETSHLRGATATQLQRDVIKFRRSTGAVSGAAACMCAHVSPRTVRF